MIKLADIVVELRAGLTGKSEGARAIAVRGLEIAWRTLTQETALTHDQAAQLAESLEVAADAIRAALRGSSGARSLPADERPTVIPPPPVPIKKRARRPLPEGVIDLSSRRRRGK